jgi:uncharacterized membrane protein YcaP (DUF421 family)
LHRLVHWIFDIGDLLLFFSDWTDLFRVVAVGTLAYVALVVFVRISGKRTLTNLNAFNLIITVALGSTLSAVLLNKAISLAEGLVAFGLLILLQYSITWLSVRWRPLEKIVKSEPTLLLHRGEFLELTMKKQRITSTEPLSAIRSSGQEEVRDISGRGPGDRRFDERRPQSSGNGDALTNVR